MLISTKGTNAIRALVDMADHGGEEKYICISCIASRLNISRKYLESIMTLLAKNKLVDVAYGKCGGYKLNKKPEEYTLLEILLVTEEKIQTVSCSCLEEKECHNEDNCCTLGLYQELHELILDFLRNKTIRDLMNNQ